MAAMQFWGVEVKGNKPYKVQVEEGHLIHLSQAVLGEVKKDSESVTVHVNVDNKKLVLGILNGGNNPQLAFDLVFDTDFEISHNWKNGSIHLLGYQSEMPEEDEDLSDFSDDEEEDVPVLQKENGKPSTAVTVAAPKAAAKLNKDNKPKPAEDSEDETDDSDEEDSDDDSEGPEDMSMGDASEDDDDDSDDEEDGSSDEEPAKPAESGKKRPKDDPKTPQSVKKAKVATPQKTDGKKGGHEATPHPSKKGGKTPGNEKSPKSGSQVSCGPCKKSFNSEVALQSHNKAKHAAK